MTPMRSASLAGAAALLASTALPLPALADAPAPEAVLGTYADIALAGYEDSLATARSAGRSR